MNFLGGAVFLVHLVDHHDGVQVHVQCLLKHKTRLGHRPLKGIDQQQHTVGHIEHALYFSSEIGVPGGVDDVDLGILVTYRNVLGKDRDPAFAFDLVVVQDEFSGLLVVAEQFAGIQKFVHQRRFPVVHVRDDGDIANVVVHTSPSLFGMCKVTKKAANAGSSPWGFLQTCRAKHLLTRSGGLGKPKRRNLASPLRLRSREKNGLPDRQPGKIRKRGDHPFNAHLYTDSSRSPPAHLT